MLKNVFSIIIFLFISLLSPHVSAIEFSPTKPETVLFENSYENWNETAAYQPKIITNNDTFHMFYTSANNDYQKVGYATSTDGIHWKRSKLYDFGFSENIHSPSILFYNATYTLTFAVDTNPRKIMSVESSNIHLFENTTLKEIIRADTPSEGTTISDPNEFIENNQRKLWYVGNNRSGWFIHLAYYEDNQWKKCSNNPVFSNMELASPSFFQYDKVNYLFFHSYRGIDYVESPDTISCSTSWSSGNNIVSSSVYFPNAVIEKDAIYLYYNLFNGGNRTIIKLPIYKETRKKTIVLVPGLFASWNKEAILHKKTVNQGEWKLNSIVGEYKGIEKTLQNLGYEINKDYYLFAYDWRKPIEQIAGDLSGFIKSKPKPVFESWNIVGHSLGGLVGKVALLKNNDFETERLITIGSPHFGAPQVYKPLSAGEFERENTYIWLAQKVIIALYKTKIESDKETLKTNFPSLLDLIPIYDFLYDENSKPTDFSLLSLKNITLPSYSNKSLSDKLSYSSISGTDINTLYGYTITKPNLLHSLLGNYTDGQPIKAQYKEGDKTVLFSSSYENTSHNVSLSNIDHGGLVSTKTGIKTILDTLEISYNEDQIEEGKKTILSPSIIFFIRSPAEMEVLFDGNTYMETDGYIFISDAKEGLYTLKVKGIDLGTYTITIGQITNTDDIWDTFEGKIVNPIPSNQTDTYSFVFNTSKLISVLTPTPTPSPVYEEKLESKQTIVQFNKSSVSNLRSSTTGTFSSQPTSYNKLKISTKVKKDETSRLFSSASKSGVVLGTKTTSNKQSKPYVHFIGILITFCIIFITRKRIAILIKKIRSKLV